MPGVVGSHGDAENGRTPVIEPIHFRDGNLVVMMELILKAGDNAALVLEGLGPINRQFDLKDAYNHGFLAAGAAPAPAIIASLFN